MNLNKNIGHDFIVMAAALVAITSCAVTELPPPDGWQQGEAAPELTPPELSPAQGVTSEPTVLQPLTPQAPTGGGEIPGTDLVVDQQKLLESHNSIRQRLGVPALSWSTRLESYAAGWANFLTTEADCIPRRRGAVGLPQNKSRLGENIQLLEPVRFGDGRTEVAAIDENRVVLEWVRQGIDYNYEDGRCRVGKSCENYTQVVWRDSQVMGCAAASCPDKSQIWVCNYDPPGNFFDQKPY